MIMRSPRPVNSMLKLALMAAATAVLAGCATLKADLEPMPGMTEPIHGAAFTDSLAIIRVTSNGCTSKDDLLPYVTRAREFSILTVRRLKEDRCNTPLEDGLEVQWTFEELGIPDGTTVTVNNPYQLRDVVVRGRTS